jgi:hypothetical protein
MLTCDEAPEVTVVATSVVLPVAEANRPDPLWILNVNVASSVVEFSGTSHPAMAARMTFPLVSVIVLVPVKFAPCNVTSEWNLPVPVVSENVPSIVAVVAETTCRVPEAKPVHGRETGPVMVDDELVESLVRAITSAITAMITATAARADASQCCRAFSDPAI